MQSIYFNNATHSFEPPKGWNKGVCHNLVIMVHEGYYSSLWKPSKSDLEILNAGGAIQLSILGGQPPVSLLVNGAEEEMFFNEPPPKENFYHCKQINHCIDGVYAREYETYEEWIDAILDTK